MRKRADFIIPECYIDTNLVETLVCPEGCNHQKGCNQVARVMQDKFADRFAVGIIDADKRRPGYLKEFKELASSEHITLFRHNLRCHFIILVTPAADGFILSCAETAGIDMSDYGLSSVLKDFTTQTKNVMSNKDSRFKRLFKSMSGIGEMKLFGDLLLCLTINTYRVENEELEAFFKQ